MKQYSLLTNQRYVFQKLFEYDKKTKLYLILFVLFSLALPLLGTLVSTIAIGLLSRKATIQIYIIFMGGIGLFYGTIATAHAFLRVYLTSKNTFTRLRTLFLQYATKIMNTDYVNVEAHDKQILMQKASDSLSSNWVGLENMMKQTPTFYINILGLLLYGAFLSTVHPLIVITLVAMTIANLALSNYARTYEENNIDIAAKYDKRIQYLYENSTSLINGKDVRIYKIEQWFSKLFDKMIKKRVKWTKQVELRYLLPNISDSLFLCIRDIIAYIFLVNMYLNDKIDITSFTLYIGITSGFTIWLNEVAKSYGELKRANLYVNNFRTYDEITEIYNHETGSDAKDLSLPLSIEFKNVSFTYPGADKPTISNLNLYIPPRQKVALVGTNGAGKTTLIKLLCGFYRPSSGEILINGNPIDQFNIYEYYSFIGAVFQDINIHAFTIAQNIACCKTEEIDYDRVWKCLELAELKEKVESLPNKEKTYITQYLDKNGVLLSGGQLQKLMLARALYKDAPIMILDEPTAALDPLAEADLYEKYNSLTEKKTSIFISHRLSSTQFCDRIIYFEHGSIVEEGTHNQLIASNGKYAEMFHVQSHYYKENVEVTF